MEGAGLKARREHPDFLLTMCICIAPFIFVLLLKAMQTNSDLWISLISISMLAALNFLSRPRPIYLVDYSCYRPRDDQSLPIQDFVDHLRLCGSYDHASVEFQRKILHNSGLGDRTHLPEAILMIPPTPTMRADREETEQAIFATLDTLFTNTMISLKDISILVVNSSLFNPTPSLSAVVVNSSIKRFNLGGMGCSAGLIALDLAKDMLQLHRSTYALVVSTECWK